MNADLTREQIENLRTIWVEEADERSGKFSDSVVAEVRRQANALCDMALRSLEALSAMGDTESAEIARLREIEHRVWHCLEDSEQRDDEIVIDMGEDYRILSSLLSEQHPRTDSAPPEEGA